MTDLPDKLRRLADWLAPLTVSQLGDAPLPGANIQDLREAADTLEAQAREVARLREVARSVVEQTACICHFKAQGFTDMPCNHCAAKAALTSTLAEGKDD